MVSAEAGAVQVEAMLLGRAPPVALVLGGAGSGRATLSARAAAELGWAHLSLDALPLELLEAGHPAGVVAGELLAAGKLIPQGVALSLVRGAMQMRGAPGYIVDGLAVSLDAIAAFEAEVHRTISLCFFQSAEASHVRFTPQSRTGVPNLMWVPPCDL